MILGVGYSLFVHGTSCYSQSLFVSYAVRFSENDFNPTTNYNSSPILQISTNNKIRLPQHRFQYNDTKNTVRWIFNSLFTYYFSRIRLANIKPIMDFPLLAFLLTKQHNKKLRNNEIYKNSWLVKNNVKSK